MESMVWSVAPVSHLSCAVWRISVATHPITQTCLSVSLEQHSSILTWVTVETTAVTLAAAAAASRSFRLTFRQAPLAYTHARGLSHMSTQPHSTAAPPRAVHTRFLEYTQTGARERAAGSMTHGWCTHKQILTYTHRLTLTSLTTSCIINDYYSAVFYHSKTVLPNTVITSRPCSHPPHFLHKNLISVAAFSVPHHLVVSSRSILSFGKMTSVCCV